MKTHNLLLNRYLYCIHTLKGGLFGMLYAQFSILLQNISLQKTDFLCKSRANIYKKFQLRKYAEYGISIRNFLTKKSSMSVSIHVTNLLKMIKNGKISLTDLEKNDLKELNQTRILVKKDNETPIKTEEQVNFFKSELWKPETRKEFVMFSSLIHSL